MADPETPRHGLADFLEEKLPILKAEWQTGKFSSLIEAYVWCAGNGYPSPEWLTEAVLDELIYSMNNRPRGGTKLSTALAREQTAGDHQVRFLLVDQLLRFQQADIDAGRRTKPLSEIEAARDAQSFLAARKGRAGNVDPETIRRSWKRLKPV